MINVRAVQIHSFSSGQHRAALQGTSSPGAKASPGRPGPLSAQGPAGTASSAELFLLLFFFVIFTFIYLYFLALSIRTS